MLRTFLITNPFRDCVNCAKLTYDEETDQYGFIIPENAQPHELPAIPRLLHAKGVYNTDDYFARKFVKERVPPPERQNIGYIMRKVGMTRYREFDLLIYNDGRSCQDDFILVEITEQEKEARDSKI